MGSTTAAGYGAEHQKRRALWKPYVLSGGVDCWRCGQPIQAGQAWDLGHDDHDRRITRGPEHATCNRATRGPDRIAVDDPDPTPRTRWDLT